MERELITCKLDKMPEGSLTSLDNAKICDVGTETASTVTARYYKGIGAHKDNMCIVAMSGRNSDNPSDRTVGAPTEQRLEPNSQGICNTLTSVQKDNLVLETECLGGINYKVSEAFQKGILKDCSRSILSNNDGAACVEVVKIKQATSQGYIECEVGGDSRPFLPGQQNTQRESSGYG